MRERTRARRSVCAERVDRRRGDLETRRASDWRTARHWTSFVVMRALAAASATASTSGRRVDRSSSRARRVVSRASGGEEEEDETPRRRLTEAELRAAVEEAREILREATIAANEQARMELTRGMAASASSDAAAAAIECLRVEAFLRARGGLNEIEAERVAQELYAIDDLYQDAEKLAVQFDRLERAIGGVPGMDVGRLVARSPELIGSDIGRATANLLVLRDLFKVQKIAGMVYDAPRLLTCEDLTERIARTRRCITRIFSSETEDDTLYAVSEEPNLLFSLCDLPIFESDVSVDISELPMSVQGACAARVVVSLVCSSAKTHI